MKFASLKLVVAVLLLLVSYGSVIAQVRFGKGDHKCGLPPGPEQRLLDAINHRRLTEVRQLLRQGVSANTKDDCQISALTYAVTILNTEIVKTLIAAGADVNAIHRYPLLIWAIDELPHEKDEEEEAKVYEIVSLLIGAGADVNLRGESDQTALILAVLAKNEKLASLLLASGADVNVLDGSKRTAYSYAAQAGFKNLKRQMYAVGADLKTGVREYLEVYGDQAFFMAAGTGRTDIVEAMLADGFDVNQANPFGATALIRAHEDSTVDVLLDAGADVNHKDKAGFTALMWAAISGNEYQVKRLIAAGADVNTRSKDGRSVLDHAAQDVRDILIRAGAKQ